MKTTDTLLNGFDLEAIDNTVSALKDNPKIAEFKFRTTNKWVSGLKNKSYIQGFYGALEENITRKTAFEYETDMPQVLNGDNTAPSPPEYFLHSLASCLTTSMMLLASSKGIEVDVVTIHVEGDINFNGFLGLNTNTLKEYQGIKVNIYVEGNITELERQELLNLARRSPIYNAVINPVAIDMSINS